MKHIRTVSHFRLAPLKRLVPAGALAALDGLCQPTGAWWQLTPSVFLQAQADGPAAGGSPSEVGDELVFRCPACGHVGLEHTADACPCPACGRRWPVEDGIYNFKSPEETGGHG